VLLVTHGEEAGQFADRIINLREGVLEDSLAEAF
jgi:ABC-type lipoprotein export system ATPase subunit